MAIERKPLMQNDFPGGKVAPHELTNREVRERIRQKLYQEPHKPEIRREVVGLSIPDEVTDPIEALIVTSDGFVIRTVEGAIHTILDTQTSLYEQIHLRKLRKSQGLIGEDDV